MAGEGAGETGDCNHAKGWGTKESRMEVVKLVGMDSRRLCAWVPLREKGFHPRYLVSAERPGPRTGVIQGTVGGAGVTALLALCLCLIFFV